MNFLKNLLTRKIHILLEPHQITVKNLDTGAEITRQPLEPYSCGRLIISHFAVFEDFLKSVMLELNPKEGLLTPSYIMYVDIKHDFTTPITVVESRSVIDACEHAGAREVHLDWEEHL
ncbi:MAG: hypothetical protein AB8B53_12115 [Flavobacteriales bacterium]